MRYRIDLYEKTKIPVNIPGTNLTQYTLKRFKLLKNSNIMDDLWLFSNDHENDFAIEIGPNKILLVSSDRLSSQTIIATFRNPCEDAEGAGDHITDYITTGAHRHQLGGDSSPMTGNENTSKDNIVNHHCQLGINKGVWFIKTH